MSLVDMTHGERMKEKRKLLIFLASFLGIYFKLCSLVITVDSEFSTWASG